MRKNATALLRRNPGDLQPRLMTCLAAMLIAIAALVGGGPSAMADGSLEAQKGGLFHRMGWISPAIYKQRERVTKQGRSSLGGPDVPARSEKKVRRKVAPKRRDTAAPKSRRKRVRTARGQRIPTKIVKRREKKLSKSARLVKQTKSDRQVRVASLGATLELPSSATSRSKSTTGGGGRIQWAASSRCVPGRLIAAIHHVARNFGRVRVNSTCRSRRQNRRAGGASKSWHLRGQAADIRVFGNIGKAARYLRRVAGGFKHYGGGLFHIDTGPRRSW